VTPGSDKKSVHAAISDLMNVSDKWPRILPCIFIISIKI